MAIHNWVENTIHALRYAQVAPFITECRVAVDLGCGREARFLRRFQKASQESWGLDIIVDDHSDGDIHLKRFDITTPLPFGGESVDRVTLLAVAEHLSDPLPLFREVHRVLRPGGRFLVTTPSRMGIWVHEVLRVLSLVQDVEEDEHKDFKMSRGRLCVWLEEAGFRVVVSRYFELGMNVFVVVEKK